MSRITGLAWDDEPDGYISHLKERLRIHGIDIEICSVKEEFIESFTTGFARGQWDFVITDLFYEEGPGVAENVGAEIAQRVAEVAARRQRTWFPIFVLTQHVERLDRNAFNLPANAALKYKGEAAWIAYYIKEELEQRGIYVDRKKVFQIHCSDPDKYKEFGEKVAQRLRMRNLTTIQVNGVNLRIEIANGLLQKMNECAAVVAVCTADDEWSDGTFHPRQNVLLEIGMALGLSRGLDRLVILQESRAVLPSDLGGVVSLRFVHSVSEKFDEMEERLQALAVNIGGS